MADVRYLKPSKDSSTVATVAEVWEVHARQWDGNKYSPVWVVNMDGKWKRFHDENLVEMFRQQGMEMFPSTNIMLKLVTDNGEEVRWELDLGYKTKLTAQDKAFMAAAPGLDLTKAWKTSQRGEAIAEVFGGKKISIETPDFPLNGDTAQVITRLVNDGWWSMDDVVAGVSGRNEPIALVDPETGNERSKEQLIAARAALGFVGRPYRIKVLGEGTVPFQGYTTHEEYEARKAAESRAEADSAESPYATEDLPF